MVAITESTDLNFEIAVMIAKIKESMANYMRKGSGWVFDHIEQLKIYLNNFKPLAGSSYIPLPSELARRKAIINVQNKDDQCFLWAILSALHHKEVDGNHAYRLNQYKMWEKELNFDGIELPVSPKAIDKFETRNANLNINIFGFDGVNEDEEEDLQLYTLRISKNNGAQHVDVLFLTGTDKQHYCWINSISRLLSSQVTEHGHDILFCLKCMNHFSRQEILDEHMEYCGQKKAVRIEMPEEGTPLASKATNVR
ncbi:unnamed protein product [Mytilus edulis]|uniref:C2H2-type domain-containing protein n=1 Tax=Mytilus edulis TaxID=6550 RepID=A0A8S3U756_MYTED|nr:unnamed protein product [Mytilus edulis]